MNLGRDIFRVKAKYKGLVKIVERKILKAIYQFI